MTTDMMNVRHLVETDLLREMIGFGTERLMELAVGAVLKEQEASARSADLCRKHGISEASFYNWKARYGGMEVSEAKRLKALEEENAKLKRLLAEQMLDTAALHELLSKNGRACHQA